MYDTIIIGAGASGLFCAANLEGGNNLILERNSKAGQKLLLSGSGQCNLTHGGDIKDFLKCYGENGKKIRKVLYKFNNLKVMDFFEKNNLPLTMRDDKKVFPKSLSSQDVVDLLIKKIKCKGNCHIKYNCRVEHIEKKDRTYIVNRQYEARNIVVATGGCSYPKIGSDGNIFDCLLQLGVKISPLNPALVPLAVENYVYKELSGISFKDVKITIEDHNKKEIRGELLFTHKYLSGPGILNISQYAKTGNKLIIDFLPEKLLEINLQNSKKTVETFLVEESQLPRRFLETLLLNIGVNPKKRVLEVSRGEKIKILEAVHKSEFIISGTAGFNVAMGTAGGVYLEEVNLNTFEHKEYTGLFIIGESLDIIGDTGGYNLQFAFSSGKICADGINEKL